MARQEELPDREMAICFRLRQFREATKIPRSTFALSVGISNDRMVSYELGRVPVRYETFKAVNARYFIRLDWLVNGRTPTTTHRPYDDSEFVSQINPRERLSTVYDEILSKHADPDREATEDFLWGPDGLDAKLGKLEWIVSDPAESKKLSKNTLSVFVDLLERALKITRKAVERDSAAEEKRERQRAAPAQAKRIKKQ